MQLNVKILTDFFKKACLYCASKKQAFGVKSCLTALQAEWMETDMD